jgi:hypothetical protein
MSGGRVTIHKNGESDPAGKLLPYYGVLLLARKLLLIRQKSSKCRHHHCKFNISRSGILFHMSCLMIVLEKYA